MLPGFGRCAGFSTSFWKIHGWLPRQALRRRMVGMASFMAAIIARPGLPGPVASRRGTVPPAAGTCIPAFRRHPRAMHLDTPEPQLDPAAQRRADRARLLRALKASLVFVLLLVVMFAAQQAMDWRAFAVLPQSAAGLLGVLTAPLLHGSPEHL